MGDMPSHVGSVFQHDNARVHQAGHVRDYLDYKVDTFDGKLQIMEWPSQSPDLNPIESVWAYIKKQLQKRPSKPSSFNHLFEVVVEEWQSIPSRVLENMIESMPRRVNMVIKNRGGSTKY